MSDVNQIERIVQDRVVKLFREKLKYTYGGNCQDKANTNVSIESLRAFLVEMQGCSDSLADRAVAQFVSLVNDTTKTLYDRNRSVYSALRYGLKVKPEHGALTETVWLIDWHVPLDNRFVISEEVTVVGNTGPGSTKRPDIVFYVNGIAVAVLELKRSTVSVSEGIRQNLDNQRPEFIEPFFSTIQWVMAGNDTQGLHYGTIKTPETFYMKWKEPSDVENPLDRALLQIGDKARLLELIHDFIVFDAGIKKVCRHNQFFGTKSAHVNVANREGGIIWHTQGSGKSLTMVWLAKWIRENVPNSRVLIVTDRTELDEQIEGVFKGVDEDIHRTASGADLIERLNDANPWLLCSLIHKFASNASDKEARPDVPSFIRELRAALPTGFSPKGEIFVFVDECHRTQSNLLHAAMREILPEATLIGFTGTPLLKKDKARSIEVFGPYIHTYKYDEAEDDGVVVGLRYEARDIAQRITSQAKIDQWFTAKTKGLNAVARAQLKARWGTMQQVLSSASRLDAIVSDIVFDMSTRDRLSNDRGNALLVASSIYEACVYYELFQKTVLKGHVGMVTSYVPSLSDLKGESTGEGETLPEAQFNAYRQMLADWFHVGPDDALGKADQYEREAKAKFVDEPGQMKLLIVVDKLLTGFDAPSATYLYIDKTMRDHGLFQAICRVNRLDGDDKEYGFIVDYKDLFKSLEGAVRDYTSEAFDSYDHDDVAGLLKDRVASAKIDFEDALEAVRALVEPVEQPKDSAAYLRFFCAAEDGNAAQLKVNEPKRVSLYELVGKAVRTFANLAGDYPAAGYSDAEFEALRLEIAGYEGVRAEVKLASGDYIDLKAYEPAMRHLIDTYIAAEDSKVISAFDDMSLVQLLVKRGEGALDALPQGLRSRSTAAATIENNVRRLIIDERPANPKYYDKMSEILDALIAKLRSDQIAYKEYLKLIVELAKQVSDPSTSESYPPAIKTPGLRAIYDLLSEDETRALAVDLAVRGAIQDGWRENVLKTGRVRKAIAAVLPDEPVAAEELLELVKVHGEY